MNGAVCPSLEGLRSVWPAVGSLPVIASSQRPVSCAFDVRTPGASFAGISFDSLTGSKSALHPRWAQVAMRGNGYRLGPACAYGPWLRRPRHCGAASRPLVADDLQPAAVPMRLQAHSSGSLRKRSTGISPTQAGMAAMMSLCSSSSWSGPRTWRRIRRSSAARSPAAGRGGPCRRPGDSRFPRPVRPWKGWPGQGQRAARWRGSTVHVACPCSFAVSRCASGLGQPGPGGG